MMCKRILITIEFSETDIVANGVVDGGDGLIRFQASWIGEPSVIEGEPGVLGPEFGRLGCEGGRRSPKLLEDLDAMME